MTDSSACPLCSGRLRQTVSERDRDGHPLRYVLCGLCGLVHVDPMPAQTDLDTWYQHAYRTDYKGVVTPRSHHVLRAGRVALERLARIRPLLADRPCALDVGAGGGETLYLMIHAAGLPAEGLEPNQGYGDHARQRLGLPVRQGFVERDARSAGAYRLITLYHVLEHLAAPRAVIEVLRDWLAPGGHLVIEVPNAEATCQSPAHSFHRAHLTTWGVPPLSRLGIACGLSVASTWTSPDGGNIQVVFRRDATAPLAPLTVLDDITRHYPARVAQVLSGHTPLRHWASGRPLTRLAARLGRQIGERVRVRGQADPRAILDSLVADWARPGTGLRTGEPGR
jgi:SAM-dependent methyltransferase